VQRASNLGSVAYSEVLIIEVSLLAENLPHQELAEIILNFLNIFLVNYSGRRKHDAARNRKDKIRFKLMNMCI
jgi:hypothetical protein